MKGTTVGGLILVILGAALLARNLGWISMDTLKSWWPVLLIVLGAGLLLSRR